MDFKGQKMCFKDWLKLDPKYKPTMNSSKLDLGTLLKTSYGTAYHITSEVVTCKDLKNGT